MAMIDGLNDAVLRATGGGSGAPELITWFKNWRIGGTAVAAPVAGKWYSLWRHDGNPPGGSAPGAVAVPVNTTAGSLLQTDPAGGREKWLTAFTSHFSANEHTTLLYDRLLHISGLSGTNTGAQTVGGTLTRNTGGIGNEIWVEIYTAVGATATTITASYTNQAGTSGRTTPAIEFGGTGDSEQSRVIRLPLATGDYGVQAVASVTVLATTGTAGDFGVTVAKPLAQVTGASLLGMHTWWDGVPKIVTDACLSLAIMVGGTTAADIFGQLMMVES